MAAKCELLATCPKTGEIRTRATLACRIGDQFGLWLSLVERLVRDQEAVGSNPTSPIGYSRGMDAHGRTIFVIDAHRDDGKRFVVHADEKLTASMELESAIRQTVYSRLGQGARTH